MSGYEYSKRVQKITEYHRLIVSFLLAISNKAVKIISTMRILYFLFSIKEKFSHGYIKNYGYKFKNIKIQKSWQVKKRNPLIGNLHARGFLCYKSSLLKTRCIKAHYGTYAFKRTIMPLLYDPYVIARSSVTSRPMQQENSWRNAKFNTDNLKTKHTFMGQRFENESGIILFTNK